MGWALHQGPKCLLIKSRLRLEPALPASSPHPTPPGTPHTQPLAGRSPGMQLSSAPSIWGKHTRRKTGRHSGPRTKAPASAAGRAGTFFLRTTKRVRSTSSVGCWAEPLTLLSLSFFLCTIGVVPGSDPPTLSDTMHSPWQECGSCWCWRLLLTMQIPRPSPTPTPTEPGTRARPPAFIYRFCSWTGCPVTGKTSTDKHFQLCGQGVPTSPSAAVVRKQP